MRLEDALFLATFSHALGAPFSARDVVYRMGDAYRASEIVVAERLGGWVAAGRIDVVGDGMYAVATKNSTSSS